MDYPDPDNPVIPSTCYDGCVRRLKPPEPRCRCVILYSSFPAFSISCFPAFSSHPTMLRHVATGADRKRDRVVLPASDVRPFTGAQRSLKVPPPPAPGSIPPFKRTGEVSGWKLKNFRGGQAVSPGPENITATRQVRTCAVVGLSADAPGKDEPEFTRPLMAGWPGWCAPWRVWRCFGCGVA